MEQIRELMAKLSSQHQQEVLDFAQYLAEKKSKPKRKKLRFDWAGGLAEFNRKLYFSGIAEEVPGLVGRLSYLIDSNVWLELLFTAEACR